VDVTQSATLAHPPDRSSTHNQVTRWLRPFAIDAGWRDADRALGIISVYDAIVRFGLLRVFYMTTASLRSVPGGSLKYQSFFAINGTYGLTVTLLTIHAISRSCSQSAIARVSCRSSTHRHGR
jgi:hypothetical protein